MSLASAGEGLIGVAVIGLAFYAAFRIFLWQLGKVMALQHRVSVARQSAVQAPADQPPA